MKRKLLYILLAMEAAVCAALSVSAVSFSEHFSSIMAFPFEQIALGLRALSLTGKAGNGAAFAILALIGITLLLPMLPAPKGQTGLLESVLNAALALGAALVIWLMANPSTLLGLTQFSDTLALPTLNAVLGIAVWSVAAAWVIVRLLRLFKSGEKEKLMGYMGKMLWVLCALFVGIAFLVCPGDLAETIQNSQNAEDVVFALLRFGINVLPYALDTVITLYAADFLGRYLEDGRGGETVAAADKLSRLCCLSLLLMSLTAAGLNIVQLAMMRHLSQVNVSMSIPVISIAFTLAVLLLSRLIEENKRLSDDNDLFI